MATALYQGTASAVPLRPLFLSPRAALAARDLLCSRCNEFSARSLPGMAASLKTCPDTKLAIFIPIVKYTGHGQLPTFAMTTNQ